MRGHLLPMSHLNVPVKTPLGHEELRQRTQRLGQRHRTVLLLVDGRRPLAEVLSMAQQAGAQTAHFEELLRLGMIELPAPEPAGPAGDAMTEPEADESVDAVASDAAADAGLPGDACLPDDAGPAEAGPADAAPANAQSTDGSADAPPVGPARAMPAPVATQERLDEARRLLVDTLRRDTLLQRVFAPARVRAARTQEDLITLVWEIERERTHARRTRGQLLNLQRARELLGMGNTVVAEDSLPWTPPGSED